jgi:hypothetical protein
LQNYFEQVGKLLIEKPLRRSSPGDNLSAVVRAQTLSVLEGLAPERKRILLLFLYESGLIYERKLVVSLVAANLSNAKLSMANLRGADLIEADLRGARGWTEEQRVTVKSLEGATMPNGQKYEDGLKSKGSREDG